jgi:hypothetical protein
MSQLINNNNAVNINIDPGGFMDFFSATIGGCHVRGRYSIPYSVQTCAMMMKGMISHPGLDAGIIQVFDRLTTLTTFHPD